MRIAKRVKTSGEHDDQVCGPHDLQQVPVLVGTYKGHPGLACLVTWYGTGMEECKNTEKSVERTADQAIYRSGVSTMGNHSNQKHGQKRYPLT